MGRVANLIGAAGLAMALGGSAVATAGTAWVFMAGKKPSDSGAFE